MALKAKIAAKRAQRQEEEKSHNKQSELQRREMGKQMAKTKEMMQAEERKRVAKQRRREKDEAKRERERLRAEIAKDKAERKARGGRLAGKLSAEGYAPSGSRPVDTMDTSQLGTLGAERLADSQLAGSSISSVRCAAATGEPKEAIAKAVKTLSKYKTADAGLIAMKTLLIYLKNIINKPDEEKYRTINTENKAFKARVVSRTV